MKTTDESAKAVSGPHRDMRGFLELTFHGAHSEGFAHDPDLADVYARVSLADDVSGGQFEFYFCSTKCLRAFLNKQVDALEASVKWMSRNRRIMP